MQKRNAKTKDIINNLEKRFSPAIRQIIAGRWYGLVQWREIQEVALHGPIIGQRFSVNMFAANFSDEKVLLCREASVYT